MSAIPEYTRRVMAACLAGHIPQVGLTNVTVEHGQGCGYKTGTCTCWPLVQANVPDAVLTIGTDGHILERRQRS